MLRKYLFFIFILMLPIAFAAPPFIQPLASSDAGELVIVYPLNFYYQVGVNTTLNFDVLNSTLSKLNSANTNCTFSIINSSGDLEDYRNLSYSTNTKNWFTNHVQENVGLHTYYVYCTSANGQNGFITQSFEIIRSTKLTDGNDSISISAILIALLIFLIAVSITVDSKEHPALKTFFLIVSVLTSILCLNYAQNLAFYSVMPTPIYSTLVAAYKVAIYSTVVFIGYILIYLIYQILSKSKQGD